MSRRSRSFNAFEQATTASIDDAVTSIPLDSVENLTPPGYLVIDPDNPLLREYIFYTEINALVLDDVSRGLAGSAGDVAQEHAAGARVRAVAVHQWLDDIFDDIEDLEDGTTVIPTYLAIGGGNAMAANLDMGGGGFRVIDMGNGLSDQDAATVKQVTDGDALLLLLDGTRPMTGKLEIQTDSTQILLVDTVGSATFPQAVFSHNNDLLNILVGDDGDFVTMLSLSRANPSLATPGTVRAGDGTQALPTFTFSSELDTGMYLESAGVLALSIDNSDVFVFDGPNGTLALRANVGAFVGSATTPAFGFTSAPGNGLYNIGTAEIALAVGGTRRFSLNDTHLEIGNGASTGAPLLGRTHSIANPAYSFVGDDDTGMERLGGNIIAWAVGGVEKMRLTATVFRSPPIFDLISGSANVSVASDGRLTQASSTMEHKTDFTPLDDPLSVIRQLNPFRFRPMGTLEDHRYRVGLGAEEVNAVIPEAEDNEGKNYDLRAVVAYLVAAVQQLAPVEA